MKIFNVRFFIGTIIVTLGVTSVLIGLAMILPPTINIIYGIALLIAGALAVKFGFIVAKDQPPSGSKVAIDTLRKAKLLDEKQKK